VSPSNRERIQAAITMIKTKKSLQTPWLILCPMGVLLNRRQQKGFYPNPAAPWLKMESKQ